MSAFIKNFVISLPFAVGACHNDTAQVAYGEGMTGSGTSGWADTESSSGSTTDLDETTSIESSSGMLDTSGTGGGSGGHYDFCEEIKNTPIDYNHVIVTNFLDNGTGDGKQGQGVDLRTALKIVNPFQTISFCTDNFTLRMENGPFEIDKPLNLIGTHDQRLPRAKIDAQNASEHFVVRCDAADCEQNFAVNMQGLTLYHGESSAVGSLAVGGGNPNLAYYLTLSNMVFFENTGGAAVSADQQTYLNVFDSAFINNSNEIAAGQGGGISSFGVSVIAGNVFLSNKALHGAGIYVENKQNFLVALLQMNTFAENKAERGAATLVAGGKAVFAFNSVHGNVSKAENAADPGAALETIDDAGTMELFANAISGNRSQFMGDGANRNIAGATVTSVISKGYNMFGVTQNDFMQQVVDWTDMMVTLHDGVLLDEATQRPFIFASEQTWVVPGLSVYVQDFIPYEACSPNQQLSHDQRGLQRPGQISDQDKNADGGDGNCDLGAVERQAAFKGVKGEKDPLLTLKGELFESINFAQVLGIE